MLQLVLTKSHALQTLSISSAVAFAPHHGQQQSAEIEKVTCYCHGFNHNLNRIMRKGTLMTFCQNWHLNATWLVLLWKTISRNFTAVSFLFAEINRFLFIFETRKDQYREESLKPYFLFLANHVSCIDRHHFDRPPLESLFSSRGSYNFVLYISSTASKHACGWHKGT